MRHRLSDLATPENIYTVQIGSAIGTHVGPGAPIGRLLGAGDLHMVSRAIPGSLAMAVPHGALHIMTLARSKSGIDKTYGRRGARINQLHQCVAASSFRRWWRAISNFVAGSVRIPGATECR